MPDPTPTPAPAPTKSLIASKTLVVNVIIALAALYPPIGTWVSAHAVLVLSVVTYANIGLRLATHQKLSLFGSDT